MTVHSRARAVCASPTPVIQGNLNRYRRPPDRVPKEARNMNVKEFLRPSRTYLESFLDACLEDGLNLIRGSLINLVFVELGKHPHVMLVLVTLRNKAVLGSPLHQHRSESTGGGVVRSWRSECLNPDREHATVFADLESLCSLCHRPGNCFAIANS